MKTGIVPVSYELYYRVCCLLQVAVSSYGVFAYTRCESGAVAARKRSDSGSGGDGKNPVYRNMKVPCGAFADFFFFFLPPLGTPHREKESDHRMFSGGFFVGFFFPPSPLPFGTAAALQTWIRS